MDTFFFSKCGNRSIKKPQLTTLHTHTHTHTHTQIDVKEENKLDSETFHKHIRYRKYLALPKKPMDQHHLKNGNDHEQETRNGYNLHYYGYYTVCR